MAKYIDLEFGSGSEYEFDFITDMRLQSGRGLRTPSPLLENEVPLELKQLAEMVAINLLNSEAIPIVFALVSNVCMSEKDLAKLLGFTDSQLRTQIVGLLNCKILYRRASIENSKTKNVDDLYGIHYISMVNMLKYKLADIRQQIIAKDKPNTVMIYKCTKCEKSYRKGQENDLINMQQLALICTSCGGGVEELSDKIEQNAKNVRDELETFNENAKPFEDLIYEVDTCYLSKAFLTAKPKDIVAHKNLLEQYTVSVNKMKSYTHPIDVEVVLSEHTEEIVKNEIPTWFIGSTLASNPKPKVIKESDFTRYLRSLIEKRGSKKVTISAPENAQDYYDELKKTNFIDPPANKISAGASGAMDMPRPNYYDKDTQKGSFSYKIPLGVQNRLTEKSAINNISADPKTQQKSNNGETVTMTDAPIVKRKYTKKKQPEVSSTSVDQHKTDATSGAVTAIEPPSVKRKYTKRKIPEVASIAAKNTKSVHLFNELAVNIDLESDSEKENASKNPTSSATAIPQRPTVDDLFKYIYPTPRRVSNIYGKFKFPCKYDRSFIYDSSSEDESAVKVVHRDQPQLNTNVKVQHGNTSYLIYL